MIFILIAYFWGGIPTAYILGKRMFGLNILHVGSGNSGATNLMFQTNFFVGILGGAIDVFIKGVFPVLFIKYLVPGNDLLHYMFGIFLLIGHNWSPYIKFRGGRGIAIFMGILFALGWMEAVLVLIFIQGLNYLVSFTINKNYFEPSFWIIIWFGYLFFTLFFYNYEIDVKFFISISVLVILIKRITANFEPLPKNITFYRSLIFRLFLDRDILKKNLWVGRKNFFSDKKNSK